MTAPTFSGFLDTPSIAMDLGEKNLSKFLGINLVY